MAATRVAAGAGPFGAGAFSKLHLSCGKCYRQGAEFYHSARIAGMPVILAAILKFQPSQ
jgi:hypothetical protein